MTAPVDAGLPKADFSAWLRGARQALRTRTASRVPCGDCRGCCTSGYFIPVGPDEKETLARIPEALLFPAPGRPRSGGGRGPREARPLLLGFRENGHCPLFIDNACSIYAHRPLACRQYDCRIFPATGISVEDGKPRIAAQAGRWEFAYPGPGDRRQQAAVRAAARFLLRHAEGFPPGFLPIQPAQRAVLALEVYEMFLDGAVEERDGDAVRARIEAVVEAAGRFAGAPPDGRTRDGGEERP